MKSLLLACFGIAQPPKGNPSYGRGPAVSVYGAPRPSQAEVLFFPDPCMPCHRFLDGKRCTRNNCKYSHRPTSLSKLVFRLKGARRSLDVCVFTITCTEIYNEIVAAHRRGVRVRVVTDDDKQDDRGSKTMSLKSQGIEVRNDGDLSHMHHKFAIIDGCVLINGSFNWTRSAVLNNRENVVISSDPYLIQAFNHEFGSLWTAFRYNR